MNRERQAMINAIKRRLDAATRRDVVRHGASAGFSGFTYYTDTTKFYNKHETAIWELLEEQYEDYGHDNPMQMIAAFNGAKQVTDLTTFKNLLAWFALEEVCRQLHPDE